MLLIQLVNLTGIDGPVSDYEYRVIVKPPHKTAFEIKRGRIEQHLKANGWLSLLRRLVEQESR